MKRFFASLVPLILLSGQLSARREMLSCGSYPDRWKDELHLHRQAMKARAKRAAALGARVESLPVAAQRDVGNIALIDDGDGVVSRRNEFNLDGKTVAFLPSAPSAARYRFETRDGGWDETAAQSGAPVRGLGDDDAREVAIPFAFPYFGVRYQSLFVNSDGNLSFGVADASSSERSLGRLTAGPPRIAALFTDLDPSREPDSVRVMSEPDRLVVSWVNTPEYRDFGLGPLRTFQIRLYLDGRIEMTYKGVGIPDAVVGISPGNLQGATTVLRIIDGSNSDFSSTIAEHFGGSEEIDTVLTAQKFYQTHEDAYDYLVIFNNVGIPAAAGAVAFEVTARNHRSGYGDTIVETGRDYGSPRRLQAVLNMGPLSQYPADPNGIVPARFTSRDTPLTVIGHEAGHLFLAFASVREPGNALARPMLGRQTAHWSFLFNSEASLLEGNRIQDNGEFVTPRFTTVATVEGFSPLDQYLMGLRAPEEVPPTFYVADSSLGAVVRGPQSGVSFDGRRRNVTVDELISAEGRRTPDHTVAQRRFRFAFILVNARGSEPTQDELSRLETYRREFEGFYRRASNERAWADTSLRRAVQLSLAPAAGVIAGGSVTATVSVAREVTAPLAMLIKTETGAASAPASVTIPTGSTRATFTVTGVRAGVEELSVEPATTDYETTFARVQVLPSASSLQVEVASGDKQNGSAGALLAQPVQVRVRDANNLPYPGMRIRAAVNEGGRLDTTAATTDDNGIASFRWTLAAGPINELSAVLEGSSIGVVATAVTDQTRPVIASGGIVNAASYAPSLAPGGFATIFGNNLSSPLQVLLNGREVQAVYADGHQVNFLVPTDFSVGPVDVVVRNQLGTSLAIRAQVEALSPGIFFNPATREGAVVLAGRTVTTFTTPAVRGGPIEIYATGLGALRSSSTPGLQETSTPVQVFIDSSPVQVNFSGLSPGTPGLYQINAVVHESTASGMHTLTLIQGGRRSNEVLIRVQ